MSKKSIIFIMRLGVLILAAAMVSFLTAFNISAAESRYSIDRYGIYELPNEQKFEIIPQYKVNRFSYGETSIGYMKIMGEISQKTIKGVYTAYSASNKLKLSFTCDNIYKDKKSDGWFLVDSDSKQVGNVNVEKPIKNGAVIIQSSEDGNIWINAVEPKLNFFDDNPSGDVDLFSISVDDLKKSMYYRVIVAYTMKHKTGTEAAIEPFGFELGTKDVYETKLCIEEYIFFVAYDKNPVLIKDLSNGNNISGPFFNTDSGFIIDKNDASVVVNVTEPSGVKHQNVKDDSTFSSEGEYTIDIINPLFKTFKYSVNVNKGLEMMPISAKVYENEKNKEYTVNSQTDFRADNGVPSLSTLKLAQRAGKVITTSTVGGYPAYGIKGDKVSLYMNLENSRKLAENGWVIESDTYGRKEKETVDKTYIGEIASGALIVQTSRDGKAWVDADKGRYENGLSTTDFYNCYKDNGDVLIYSFDGKQVIKGLYVRVLYAYKMTQSSTKTTKRYIEEYKFYICSDELDAVTFHNLSVDSNMLKEFNGVDNDVDISVYKLAETLLSGSYTTRGFTIDTSLNPTVTCKINYNGKPLAFEDGKKYTYIGKYEISIKSAVGSERKVVIYVDTSDNEGIYKKYFGDGFITGKRIFDENCEYPVFEGGKTYYNISEINVNTMAISGQIVNNTTNDIIDVHTSLSKKTGALTTPGDYTATFYINKSNGSTAENGDVRTIIFNFRIIEEGTAPGPVVNKRSLEEYAHSSATDSYPKYYGVTYQSASKGNITIAFKDKADTLTFARRYEEGLVEDLEDGTFRYKGPYSIGDSQKEKYDDKWELPDAINYFAELAVQELYFDMSDYSTYTSLNEKDISEHENLRELSLDESIVIFADDDNKFALTDTGMLPIINDKPFRYSAFTYNNRKNAMKSGTSDFEFVSDKYGCDSYSVVIIDENGKEYEIEYKKSVGKQLAEKMCPTGIITIRESTKYGDTAEYQAVYIAENENTTNIKLSYFENNTEKSAVINQKSGSFNTQVESFSIAEISDKVDEYAIVAVTDPNKKEYVYVADEKVNKIWNDAGEYNIAAINRLGYKYEVKITVKESDKAAINFSGDGTQELESIIVSYGDKDVRLPKPVLEGYTFIGYSDADGNIYTDTIPEIKSNGSIELKANWSSGYIKITYVDQNNKKIYSEDACLGTVYKLMPLKDSENCKFVGWEKDGKLLDSDIEITEKRDITLKAVVETDDEPMIEAVDGTMSEEPPSVSRSNAPIVIGIVIIVGIGAFLAFRNKEKILKMISGDKKSDE